MRFFFSSDERLPFIMVVVSQSTDAIVCHWCVLVLSGLEGLPHGSYFHQKVLVVLAANSFAPKQVSDSAL